MGGRVTIVLRILLVLLWMPACATLSDTPWPDGAGAPKDSGPDGAGEIATEVAQPDAVSSAGTKGDIGKTPPTAQWLSPAPGTIVSLSQEVTFSAEVSSLYLQPADLQLAATLTSGPIPGLAKFKADAAGKVQFTTTLLPAGPQTVVLKVIDGANPATELALNLYVNSPPGTPQVAISPAQPGSGEDLHAKVVVPGADVDLGQAATQSFLYEWRVDELPTDVTTATLPASKTEAGQTWSVQVRAFDGLIAGPPGVAWVTIGNTPPQLPKLVVEPAQPTVADTLVCAMALAATDVDGQPLQYKASWTRNGQPWTEVGHKGTLKLAEFAPGLDGKPGAFKQLIAVQAGDVVQCHLLVSDGADIAGPATSTEATLSAFDGCVHTEAPCALAATCTPTQTAEVICTCKPGYVGDGKQCQDRNECTDGSNACDPAADCTNTLGSYTCGCPSGWTGDGWKCLDLNECALGTAACDLNSDCTNTAGGYGCVCKPGWVDKAGTGVCADQDSCALGLLLCDPHAACINLPGPDTCTCDLGWASTATDSGAVACVDLNECATPTGTDLPACVTGAICTNLPGGFDCTCGPGWSGDGQTCANVDECALGTYVCAATASCMDLDGDYQCQCGKGYLGDGKICDDVDECALGTAGCDAKATCTNLLGSFQCTCKEGFIGDGKSCKAVAP